MTMVVLAEYRRKREEAVLPPNAAKLILTDGWPANHDKADLDAYNLVLGPVF